MTYIVLMKYVRRGKIDSPNTQIQDRSLTLLGTGTSIKSGGFNLATNKISEILVGCTFYLIKSYTFEF